MNSEKVIKRVAIIVPALNESESIVSVIAGSSVFGTVIVVDDGSADNTGELASRAGAALVVHKKNCGYDAALVSGLTKAISDGFHFAVTVDADGQHAPESVISILRELFDGADVVIGIREIPQRISEMLFAAVTTRLWNISDPLCGLKGYNLESLKRLPYLSCYSSTGTEIAIRAARSGWDVREVPVATLPRKGNPRFGTGLKANWFILRSLILGLLKTRPYRLSKVET